MDGMRRSEEEERDKDEDDEGGKRERREAGGFWPVLRRPQHLDYIASNETIDL